MALGQLLREICHEPGSLRNRLLNDLSCAMGGILNRFALGLLAAALLAADAGAAASASPEVAAAHLRDEAMAGHSVAHSWVSELTTRIGPRPAGSANEHQAAQWAVDKLKSLGFENVHVETFPLTGWVRGTEHAEIVAPNTQPLVIAALGQSPPTPAEGLVGEVVIFPTLEDLRAAPKGSLTGKIAMVDRRMVRTQDPLGYAQVGPGRYYGAAEAAERGAVGYLFRSAGTDSHRMAHTGSVKFTDGRVPVPAFALSNPDADQIDRLTALGEMVRVRMFSTSSYVRDAQSQNVIAEVRGKERPQQIVMLGAHLDSWDQGTGAIDDAAGTAIITGAAKLIRDLPQKPRSTVRIVLFGSEEIAQPVAPFMAFGGHSYADTHEAELPAHVLTGESDLGADRIYALALPKGVAADSEFSKAVFRLLTPIGILPMHEATDPGTDIGPSVAGGVPAFQLFQDGLRYFDFHHTPDDTLDKIDRQQLDQNVAAWAVVAWLAANSDVDFRAAP
jgi:carboxypeptidase Q